MKDHAGGESGGPAPTHVGRLAEDLAARYLLASGFELLARNVRAGPGELDIVARDGRTIVFVEVRCRRQGAGIGPAASVTARKRTRLLRAAEIWIGRHGFDNAPCRFDLIAVTRSRDGFRLRHDRGVLTDDEAF